MRIGRFVCRLVLPVGIVVGGLGAAHAAVSEEVRQACTPDAMRLCSEFIPDAAKVKTCMMRKRGQLSLACRTAIRHGHAPHRRAYHHYRRRHHRHHHRG